MLKKCFRLNWCTCRVLTPTRTDPWCMYEYEVIEMERASLIWQQYCVECDWNHTRPCSAQVLTTITNHVTSSQLQSRPFLVSCSFYIIPILCIFNSENFIYLSPHFTALCFVLHWRPQLSCCHCAHLEQSSSICNSIAISADFSEEIRNWTVSEIVCNCHCSRADEMLLLLMLMLPHWCCCDCHCSCCLQCLFNWIVCIFKTDQTNFLKFLEHD